MRRLHIPLLLLLPSGLSGQAANWRIHHPGASHMVLLAAPELTESSGVIRSRHIAGVFFTINDSGNQPVIFATDTGGRALGSWLVPGVNNRDWEAISAGTCPAGSCLYLGDTGDNKEQQLNVVIYRVREPRSLARFLGEPDPSPLDLDSLTLHFPDGPHDVEAMYLDDAGTLFLVTKGRSGGVLLFRVPQSSWTRPGVADAQALGKLPIPGRNSGDWVTDAARLPGTRRVVIRTYNTLYFFTMKNDGRLLADRPPHACDITGLEAQGEGVDWIDPTHFVLTSERGVLSSGTLRTVQCSP